ncbi:hypothetical protein [Caenimonas koreensis]|uniref:Uncharacterized protein n=1 Tax=Caenimonas koreensis DSM 17982 TaxID=1121255 RepID=A0A844BC04_9BURK|nr:hypothetical protein [Caenimonas koreensis]MRD48031.1 hypothetical protein [Caenimonas koreensis DSM 17982]
MSVSFIAAASHADREDIRASLAELIATHPALKGKDRVSFPYRTVAYHCARI